MRNQAGLEGMDYPSHPGRPANAVANKPCTMSPHEGRTRPRDAARKTSHDLDKPRDAKRRHAAVGQLGVKRSPVQIRPARLVEQVFLLASRPTLDYHSHYYCDPHPATAMRGLRPSPMRDARSPSARTFTPPGSTSSCRRRSRSHSRPPLAPRPCLRHHRRQCPPPASHDRKGGEAAHLSLTPELVAGRHRAGSRGRHRVFLNGR